MVVLAVDGGQSGTRVCVSAAQESPSTLVELPGVTRLDDPYATIPRRVRDAVEHLQHPPVERVVVGLTTAPEARVALDALAGDLAQATGAAEVWVADDTVTTHAAAHRGGQGVSVWIGTGVACYALAPHRKGRKARRFDGLGFLLGDRGGAFSIGQRALTEVMRAWDLMRPAEGVLAERVEAAFGPLERLAVRLHDSDTVIHDVAAFAREVAIHAETDPQARRILSRGVEDLAETIRAAVGWVGEPAPVVVGGGLPTMSPVMQRALTGELAPIAFDLAERSAIEGALWLGHQQSPGPYGEAVYVWRRP